MGQPAGAGEGVLGPEGAARAAEGGAWTFRGYQMRPAEFAAAMAHFYRAEIQRSNTWRQRLDTTTNWAVITTGAGLSFSLSTPEHNHAVILLTALLVTLFLWVEARRYRYYELWSYRVRLMEIDYFAAMLRPPFTPRADWAENLSSSLVTPRFPISTWEALGRRCRRNYIWIFVVLDLAWVIKGLIHPGPVASWADFVDRYSLGPVPGAVMLAAGLGYTVVILVVAFATAGLREAGGEVLPDAARPRFIRRLRRR